MRNVIDSPSGKGHETLRALLAWEKGEGVHKPGGVLADPSAAIALLWTRRTRRRRCVGPGVGGSAAPALSRLRRARSETPAGLSSLFSPASSARRYL